MNTTASELEFRLRKLMDTHFAQLTTDQQLLLCGMLARYEDLAATERFFTNSVMNAGRELDNLEARLNRGERAPLLLNV